MKKIILILLTLLLVSSAFSISRARALRHFYNLTVDNVAYFANGTTVAPSIAFTSDTDTGFYRVSADRLGIALAGSAYYQFSTTKFGCSNSTMPAILRENGTATNPNIVPEEGDVDTGIGLAAADQLSLIAGGTEIIRCRGAIDTDFDDTDVWSTGLLSGYGLLIVRESAGTEICQYLIAGATIEKISGDATFTVTKDNAATYNVYWETDQFKIQNKVGDNKNMKWVYWGME